MKKFFEGTFLDGIMMVFDTFLDIFKAFIGVFSNIIEFIINIPFCIPIWFFDVGSEIVGEMTPQWVKEFNKNVVYPIMGLIAEIVNFFGSLLGFKFKFSLGTQKCYPSIEKIFDPVMDMIKELTSGF